MMKQKQKFILKMGGGVKFYKENERKEKQKKQDSLKPETELRKI